MRKNTKRKVKRINIKMLLFLVFLVTLICLMIHPIELIKGNFLKPLSEAIGSTSNTSKRYSETPQNEVKKLPYVDGYGREYNVEFKENSLLGATKLLYYENVIQNTGKLEKDNTQYKNLYLAEMAYIPSRNYEERYVNSKYYDRKVGIPNLVLDIAKEDATITKTENSKMEQLWGALKLGKYLTINGKEEQIVKSKIGTFEVGNIYATTRTATLYKKTKTLTVSSGVDYSKISRSNRSNYLTAAEAYILATYNSNATRYDVDKNQQALWIIKEYADAVSEIPVIEEYADIIDEESKNIFTYKGLNEQAIVTSDYIIEEAKTLNEHVENMREFKENHKIDSVETEIYDNMWNEYLDTDKNHYENGMAGLVAYEEAKEEFLVGPFSIDYARTVFVPTSEGGQSEKGIIIFNEIINAEVWGIDGNGEAVQLTDWEFVYPNLEYDAKAEKTVRTAEKNSKDYDPYDETKDPYAYPYPNEVFYLRCKNVGKDTKGKSKTIEAITDFKYTTRSINAEATVDLYEGKYYDVSWVGAVSNGKSYLQMTPSWSDIENNRVNGSNAADIYQVREARIVYEEKTMTISVGKYHNKYNDYCIPLTMELGGNVWLDGNDEKYVKGNGIEFSDSITVDNKKVDVVRKFGIRDEYKGEYIENGIEGVKVYLYDEDGNKKAETVTDENGDYLFQYVLIGPKYYIEFSYDGMRYRSTTNLIDRDTYKSTDQFLNFLNHSHTIEAALDRANYNSTYKEIKTGDSRTNGKLITIGKAISSRGESKNVGYVITEETTEFEGSTASVSRYDILARTKTNNLLFPLQDKYIITNKDISLVDKNQKYAQENYNNIFVLGTLMSGENYITAIKLFNNGSEQDGESPYQFKVGEKTTSYAMVDTYLHHINLGLIEREPVDLAVKNDVSQTMITFLNDEPDVNILGYGIKEEHGFDVDSRVTDQYFRMKYEHQEIPYDKYTWKHDFTTNTESIENDNAQMYVQYKMTIKNQAVVTSGKVTELVNYYDKDFYYPVNRNEMWLYYDKEKDYVDYYETYKAGYGNMVIPQLADYTSWAVKFNKDDNKVDFEVNEDGKIVNKDVLQVEWLSTSVNAVNDLPTGEDINRMYTTSLKDVELGPGEYITLYVIYKVEQKAVEQIKLENGVSILNGSGSYISNDDNGGNGKRNIIEINSYESINYDGSIGGRVDKDSAPGNSDVSKFKTFEDDTDMAPYFKVLVGSQGNKNSISGYVWEDDADRTINSNGNSITLGMDVTREQVINGNKMTTFNNQRVGNGQIDFGGEGPGNGVNLDTIIDNSLEKRIDNVMVELIRLEYSQEANDYVEVQITDEYKKFYPNTSTVVTSGNDNAVVCWTGELRADNKNGKYEFNNLVSGGEYQVRFNYGLEDELLKRFDRLNNIGVKNQTLYNGHDYKSTTYKGRIDVSKISDPKTDIYFVIDTYEIAKKKIANNNVRIPIINVLTDVEEELNRINSKIRMNVVSYGIDGYKTFSDIKTYAQNIETSILHKPETGRAAIDYASKSLVNNNNDESNKIMVIYNDGKDEDLRNTRVQVADALNNGVTVIGIGNGSDSLEIYKVDASKKVSIHSLTSDENSNKILKETLYNEILDVIIDKYYFEDITASHAEDCLKEDAEKYTYKIKNETGEIKEVTRTVDGRVEVMKYSQVIDSKIADELNLGYMKNLWEYIDNLSNKERATEEVQKQITDLTNRISTFANKTKMTANSYKVSFKGDDYIERKTLNLGLQEIPERKVEMTNQVDRIVIRLANGEKIIDWSPNATDVKNVQEIVDRRFSIYMDEEIMQGATVEVIYKINISNIGEVDTLYNYIQYAPIEGQTDKEYDQIDFYKDITGKTATRDNITDLLWQTETIEISKVYSYYDDLIFRAEDNNKWEILNKTVENYDKDKYNGETVVKANGMIRDREGNLLYKRDNYNHLIFSSENTLSDGRLNVRDKSLMWTSVKNLDVVERNRNNVENNYLVVETTSLQGIELYPNVSSEVRKTAQGLKNNSNTVTNNSPISTVCTYLVLSKVLSAEDMNIDGALDYINFAEIVETVSNTGRRAYNGIEGNFTGEKVSDENEVPSLVSEDDIDAAERIVIMPPFGDKKIMIGLIVAAMAVLGVGVIFIKKKVL